MENSRARFCASQLLRFFMSVCSGVCPQGRRSAVQLGHSTGCTCWPGGARVSCTVRIESCLAMGS